MASQRLVALPADGVPPDDGQKFAGTSRPATDVRVGRARASGRVTRVPCPCAYIYQGEELGLPEVEDLPTESLRTRLERSGHTVRGARVPRAVPWSGRTAVRFRAGHRPALAPQPRNWAT